MHIQLVENRRKGKIHFSVLPAFQAASLHLPSLNKGGFSFQKQFFFAYNYFITSSKNQFSQPSFLISFTLPFLKHCGTLIRLEDSGFFGKTFLAAEQWWVSFSSTYLIEHSVDTLIECTVGTRKHNSILCAG